MKVKATDLTGAALDWAVAKCEDKPIVHDPMGFKSGSEAGYWIWDKTPKGLMTKIGRGYAPSADWAQGGPIIEREKIDTSHLAQRANGWYASQQPDAVRNGLDTGSGPTPFYTGFGPTPLIAAMRCYVASKLGATVEVPNELK